MRVVMILKLFTLHVILYQTRLTSGSDLCKCEMKNTEKPFPQQQLNTVGEGAVKCNQDINPQKALDFDGLLLALEKRLPQLADEVSELERENDGDLYGTITLQVIHNSMADIQELLDTLNSTRLGFTAENRIMSAKLQEIKEDMKELEMFDTTQTVKRQQTNNRLKRDLDRCKNGHAIIPLVTPAPGACPHGRLVNVKGPRVYTMGEYPGSFKFGSWGRDPKPAAGKEDWYWLVILTSGNSFAHYVRRYTSLSSLIVGISSPGNVMISASNPTTNTILGPNAVLYGEALYYNCYKSAAVCRFNLTSKTVQSAPLPHGTRFGSQSNFCHLDACYAYTDLDLATDESGVWVVYTTAQDHGNMVLALVEEGEGEQPSLGQTWHTSLYKGAATNSFVACGVLYATRYVSKDVEEIFYSFDTATGVERFDVGIPISKMGGHIYSLNYSPVDSVLHAYGEALMTSYKVEFL